MSAAELEHAGGVPLTHLRFQLKVHILIELRTPHLILSSIISSAT